MRKILFLIAAVALFITGCTHDHSNEESTASHSHAVSTGNDNDHDHEDISLQITAYSDRHEIYAEAVPLAQGISSDVLVHVTRLEDFKPLRHGRITVTLAAGNSTHDGATVPESTAGRTIENPDTPGIFRFSLLPPETGRAELRFIIEPRLGTARADTIVAGGLYVYDDEHGALHAAEEMHEEHPGAVIFTKEKSWPITFATSPAERVPFGPVLRTVGEVLPARGDDAILTSQTAGIISFTHDNPYEGIRLSTGEPLLEVLGGSLAEGNAAVRYAEAQNNYRRAEADYLRLSALAENSVVSERELLQAENSYQNARAVYENLRENFSERGQTVTAPFASYLHDLYVNSGQFVEAGEPLARVGRNNRMVIRAGVQQGYSHLLENIYTANIIAGDRTLTLEELGGSVLSLAREVSPRNHLIPVHLHVDARPELFFGGLVDVYLRTRSSDRALVVPSTALIEEQGYYFVYVQIHPESFEKREVQTGHSDGLLTEITAGLAENERIVTLGAVMVKAASSTGNIDAHSGHVH